MKRIFLVGSPRSGTTLYQRLVSAQETLTTFPESHFFYHLCGDSRWRRALRLARTQAAKTRLLSFLEESGAEAYSSRVESCSSWFYEGWVDLFVGILDDVSERRGAEGWLEKTPMHLHYVNLIERYLERPRFLHILRSGDEVVASVRRVTRTHPESWGGPRSVTAAVDRWLFDVEQHRKHLGKTGHFFTLYDNLVRDPEKTIRETCDFLGLSFSSSMMESAPRDDMIQPGESWKRTSTQPVSPTARTSSEEALSDEELRYVRHRIASVDLSVFS